MLRLTFPAAAALAFLAAPPAFAQSRPTGTVNSGSLDPGGFGTRGLNSSSLSNDGGGFGSALGGGFGGSGGGLGGGFGGGLGGSGAGGQFGGAVEGFGNGLADLSGAGSFLGGGAGRNGFLGAGGQAALGGGGFGGAGLGGFGAPGGGFGGQGFGGQGFGGGFGGQGFGGGFGGTPGRAGGTTSLGNDPRRNIAVPLRLRFAAPARNFGAVNSAFAARAAAIAARASAVGNPRLAGVRADFADSGTVTLSGDAPAADRKLAAALARLEPGVTGVVEDYDPDPSRVDTLTAPAPVELNATLLSTDDVVPLRVLRP